MRGKRRHDDDERHRCERRDRAALPRVVESPIPCQLGADCGQRERELEHQPRQQDHAADAGHPEEWAIGLRDTERGERDAAERHEHSDGFGNRVGGGPRDDSPATRGRDRGRRGMKRGEQHRRDDVAGCGQEPHPPHPDHHPNEPEGEPEASPPPACEIVTQRQVEADDAENGEWPKAPRGKGKRHDGAAQRSQAEAQEWYALAGDGGHQPSTRSAKTTIRWAVEPGG